MRRVLTAFLACLGLVLAASPAHAYVRSETCGPAPNRFPCEAGEDPIAVAWSTKCLVVHLNETGTQHVPFDEVQRVTELAAEIWSRVECSYLSVTYGGLTNEDRVGYNPSTSANANVVMFRDSAWSHTGGILALTSVTFDRNNGEIVDADIEFNTRDFGFTSSASQVDTIIDLENTMVHEMGHMVGLDHTMIEEATMYASAPAGEIKKRSLHQDDIDGLCDAYALAFMSGARSCPTQRIGYFEKPTLGMTERPADDGCSMGPARAAHAHDPWAGVGVLSGLTLVALRRRRRPAATSTGRRPSRVRGAG